MKIAAVICNVVLFAFTCMVLLNDDFPAQAAYIVFNVWLLLTPILSLLVLIRGGAGAGRPRPHLPGQA